MTIFWGGIDDILLGIDIHVKNVRIKNEVSSKHRPTGTKPVLTLLSMLPCIHWNNVKTGLAPTCAHFLGEIDKTTHSLFAGIIPCKCVYVLFISSTFLFNMSSVYMHSY